jgi:hypothetical protein
MQRLRDLVLSDPDMTYVPYEQREYVDRINRENRKNWIDWIKQPNTTKGMCLALAIDEVVDRNNDEQQRRAHLKQLEYGNDLQAEAKKELDYCIKQMSDQGKKGEDACKTHVQGLARPINMRLFVTHFLKEKKPELEHVETILSDNIKSSSEIINNHSNNFQEPATFLTSVSVHNFWGTKVGSHALRFDTHGNDKCSAYDANQGRFFGKCTSVSQRFNRMFDQYNTDRVDIAVIKQKPK